MQPRLAAWLLLSCLLVMAPSACSQATPAAPSNTTAAPAPEPNPYGHKTLTPLSPNDIALSVVVAVALFIASGAGVGGGMGAAIILSYSSRIVCMDLIGSRSVHPNLPKQPSKQQPECMGCHLHSDHANFPMYSCLGTCNIHECTCMVTLIKHIREPP